MPETRDGRLGTPEAWIGEVASALLAQTTPPAPLSFALTYRAGLPDRMPVGADVDDLVDDLAAGFVSHRRGGRDGEYYILRATRFDVFVHTELTQSGMVPLAVINKVELRRGLPTHGPIVHAQVAAHPPYDEQWCDIADVHGQVQAWLHYERARQRAWDRSEQLLRRGGRAVGTHADLHARVRRHFGALEQMITLLQQRSETEGTLRARGIVTGRAGGTVDVFTVRLTQRDSGFGDEENVEVSVPGQRRPVRLELVAVDGDEAWVSLPDAPRAQAALTPGAHVGLACTPRFGLKRHGYALSRLLHEEVEGDWDSLARLVSDPASMAVPAPFGILPRYFDEGLNDQQRAAVAGAVRTPHAYFIQGPPGTGKTTVICEVIRQLTARGERVLLLAPMHVAVDEALRRVGHADGVLALRASYDDSKVREELRRFTKSRLTAEFIRKARTPQTARSGQWRAEAATLRGERELIGAAIAADQERARAGQSSAAVRRDRADMRARYETALAQAARDIEEAARALARQRYELAEAERWAQAASQALATAEAAGPTLVQRLLAAVGTGELLRLRAEDARARSRRETAAEQVRMAAETRARLAAALGQLRQQGADLDARHGAAESRAAAAVVTAWEQLASACGALQTAGINVIVDVTDPAWPAELAELAAHRERRETRLDQLVYLEGRWFQLAGLADIGVADQDAQQQVVADLGDSLVGAANVVCCTTTGFGGDSDIRDADFDTLIVDEASRVIDSEFLIGARQARRWVLVGDEHQLPPHVSPADEHHLHALAALHMTDRAAADDLHAAVSHLAELWREDEEVHQYRTSSVEGLATSLSGSGLWQTTYSAEYQKAYDRLRADGADAERELLRKMRHHLVQSIFERCVADGPKELRGPLVQQHRMIDPIAALVRDPIYEGNYLTPPPGELRVVPLMTSRTFPEPVVFLDTSGYPGSRETQEGSGCFNELEARLVANACRAWDRELAAQGEREVTVSVLTFYKAQARNIRQRLGAPKFKDFRVLRFRDVDSIDRLQGQESDLIIISFCRASPRQHLWLQDVRRLNVACTRAKRGIVLVGHKKTLTGLRGIPAAEHFYAHMFGLFADGAPGTVLLKQLEETGR
jgi:hypothetical protein